MLQTRVIPPTANANQAPLLIKRLLLSGSRYEKTREIVYRDQMRYSYATFNERVARLANVLSEAGVKAGDTVAVMDWDSHRYLECMFAIPMIGAVLHTINIRLSADQILYTMNHAEDRFVLVNSEFVPLYKGIEAQLTTVEKTILLTDGANTAGELPPRYVAVQGTALGRAGRVHVERDAEGQVWIGGDCVGVIQGQVTL